MSYFNCVLIDQRKVKIWVTKMVRMQGIWKFGWYWNFACAHISCTTNGKFSRQILQNMGYSEPCIKWSKTETRNYKPSPNRIVLLDLLQAYNISDSVLLLLYFWSLSICKEKGCITRGKLESWLPPPAKLDDWESCHRAVSQALDHTAVSQYHSITVSQVGKVAAKQYHKR